ncbi:hypothetical protein HMPREF1869_00887 [Bacteroidales bacterium KA00251]|nr:hypothetical protein HMPREF1869_00887 [Bacteroidales bacterium KA00251]
MEVSSCTINQNWKQKFPRFFRVCHLLFLFHYKEKQLFLH